MLASVKSFTLLGIDAVPVTAEVDLHSGVPIFNIVGLPDTAVREARERVRAAIKNAGFEFPLKRITVNLAPADLHKTGPIFDLAIACGLLVASYQLKPGDLAGVPLCGELALDGSLRAVKGALSVALAARDAGHKQLVLPEANRAEAAAVGKIKPVGLSHLADLRKYFDGTYQARRPTPVRRSRSTDDTVDLSQVQGQEAAKEALTIAAAGGHNLLLVGPPGSGKTMLARCLPGLLPPLTKHEAIETTQVYSISGVSGQTVLFEKRPFRAPHHTASMPALVGGGSPPRPGEISLAHNGVLFLDELAEFGRAPLEALRQPLEEGTITVARAASVLTFPARFLLVAATNPCPCGFAGDPRHLCSCDALVRGRYRNRISGPLLDRIDLVVTVKRPRLKMLYETGVSDSPQLARRRVQEARKLQASRLGTSGLVNGRLDIELIRRHCSLTGRASEMIDRAENQIGLGGRGFVRALRVARTVADLAGKQRIDHTSLAVALAYRQDYRESRSELAVV